MFDKADLWEVGVGEEVIVSGGKVFRHQQVTLRTGMPATSVREHGRAQRAGQVDGVSQGPCSRSGSAFRNTLANL
jgi:hypothetical protein